MRRAIFLVHLCVGVTFGLYVLVVSVTGAALVFRIDMQRARHPHLFTPSSDGPPADPVTVMHSVVRAYFGHRLSGVEAPTTLRPTYLAYVTRGPEFVTVLIDPVSAAILGELPPDPLIESIQALHFNLMGGRTGRIVNGVGAGAMLAMCATGLVIWWPGRRLWRRGFTVDIRRDWRRIVWESHRAVGIWTMPFMIMTAGTGLSFVFPAAFRAMVSAVSPITVGRAPTSGTQAAGTAPSWEDVVARARAVQPRRHVARVVLPFNDRAAYLIMFADRVPTPAGSSLSPVYLDQYSGALLADGASASRTPGDAIMSWLTPLHVGGLGGGSWRWLWFALGLGPSILFVTGLLTWWNRVVRPWWTARAARAPSTP